MELLRGVSSACCGILYTYKGFIWVFKNEETAPKKLADSFLVKLKNKIDSSPNKPKPVLQYNKQLQLICRWGSAWQAAKELKMDCRPISRCCSCEENYKTSGGFIWRYADELGNPTLPLVPVSRNSGV